MTIYFTGRGDKGKSDMGAKKIEKDDPLFEALGSLDELNSWIGYCRTDVTLQNLKLKNVQHQLKSIQETLFIAQAELAMMGMERRKNIKYQISNIKTKQLEEEIIKIDKAVPQIKQFIIPGASELSAKLDLARAFARRVERAFVAYNRKHPLNPDLLQYLNRLSSILFAHARFVNVVLKKKEENPSYK